MTWITDNGGIISFTDAIGKYEESVMFGFIMGETSELTDELKAEFDASYEFVGVFIDGDADFYQGISKVFVIRRKSDGAEFGYAFWDDISKHGETFIDMNNYDDETYDFTPVSPSKPIPTYEFAE